MSIALSLFRILHSKITTKNGLCKYIFYQNGSFVILSCLSAQKKCSYVFKKLIIKKHINRDMQKGFTS
jgi:hypothetical protein